VRENGEKDLEEEGNCPNIVLPWMFRESTWIDLDIERNKEIQRILRYR